MKRAMTGENDFDQNKRSRSSNRSSYEDALADGKFEIRLLIPSKSAGAVIGKGGAFIKDIRTKFDAIVTIPDKSKTTPERVLTIICSQETIIDCFTEIFKKLEEDQLGEPEVFMLLHQSHAAAVIGAGGANITKLREQTNSHLRVFNECCPNSDDRLFMISCAQQEQLIEIVKKTIAFLKKVPIKGFRRQYDPENYDPYLDYGGFGYKGSNFRGRGRGSGGCEHRGGGGGRRDLGRDPSPPQYGGSSMGSRGGGGQVVEKVEIVDEVETEDGGGGIGGGGHGGRSPSPAFGGHRKEVESAQKTIPSKLIGTIVGKDGQLINRGKSHAKIEIDTTTHGADERIICITGTPSEIEVAQRLIDESLRKSAAGRRYLKQLQLKNVSISSKSKRS